MYCVHVSRFLVEMYALRWTGEWTACWHAGVADGVGGWRTYGVDPSQFPKSLMAACERMVHSGQFTPCSPVDVLSSGYQEIQQDKAPLIGRLSLTSSVTIQNTTVVL